MSDAAEHARACVAGTTAATLATLSADGGPWASVVAIATLDDGAPVLCVSDLAEHGRNLARDPRASVVAARPPAPGEDPLALGRTTLAGRAERPTGADDDRARAAYLAQVPGSEAYAGFGDFALWVLRVARVRWVGGYGRMQTVDAAAYAAAPPWAIRDARPAEAAALEALQRRSSDVWEEDRAHLAAHPDAIAAPVVAIAEGRVRVAVQGARILGFAVGLDVAAGRCELDDLFVEPAAMRRGVGRALVDDLARRARHAGASAVGVIANPRALGFYERAGFVADGTDMTRFGPAPRMRRAL